MARGKLKMKRCKNGTRRHKKTKKCVKKLNSKAKARTVSFKTGVKTLKSIPRKTVSGVITGVKEMEDLEVKAIESLPKLSAKKSKSKSKSVGRKHINPWIAHLSAYRRAHTGMKWKTAMKQAKKTYKKVK